MKIDVEGFEMQVVLGGDALFRTRPPTVLFLEYCPWNLKISGALKNPQDLLSKLGSYGYKLAHIGIGRDDHDLSRSVLPQSHIQELYKFPGSPGEYYDLVFVH